MADIIEQKIVDLSIDVLDTLLKDKSTHKHIVWATDNYQQYGEGYLAEKEILPELISGMNSNIIQPRVTKALAAQAARTKQHAEVFTPCWMCNLMNNSCDEEWFGKKDLFNTSTGSTWESTSTPIPFEDSNDWKKYVDSRRLEITCGEAPYIVSRYDTSTGDVIPIAQRIGILDRKLRVVNENTQDINAWQKWATRAIQAVYGFEYQGDNLVIARINVLMTFAEYMIARWKQIPDKKLMQSVANIISWNFWQMNGYTNMPPCDSINGTAEHELSQQMSMFETDEPWVDTEAPEDCPCYIHNWRGDFSFYYKNFKERAGKTMHIDFVIGNPPYQGENDKNERKPPVYHVFMDAAYDVASVVELITPARFLFNAGQTPKKWNQKMLEDEHIKVLFYEPDGERIFPNTDIKGGVCVTIRNQKAHYGKIGTYTAHKELNSILQKINAVEKDEDRLNSIVSPRGLYRVTEKFFSDFPYSKERVGAGTGNMLVSNFFDKLPEVFLDKESADSEYITVVGRSNNMRESRILKKEYIIPNNYLDTYNVTLPEANGSGSFGESLSSPFISGPGEGATDTFINIGNFQTKQESLSLLKYIKAKFVRALLGVKKATQHNPPQTWSCIPLQNFTSNSDIDWNVPVSAIDRQLYRKYNLSDEEIEFIETHVKEMV